jgi:hypothetical protein
MDVVGAAHGVRTFYEQFPYQRITVFFDIVMLDEDGRVVRTVPAAMKGFWFRGSIIEGDWVRASGRLRGERLMTTRVVRLPNGDSVGPRITNAVFTLYSLFALVAGGAWIAYVWFSAGPQ